MLPRRRLLAVCVVVPAAVLLAQIPTVGADDAAVRYGARDANGLTTAELDRLLSSDTSAHIDDDGRVYFVEPAAPAAHGSGRAEGVAPFPLNQTFQLHSNPTSTRTLFIDVDGTHVSGTAWNSSEDLPAADYPAWDPGDNGVGFTDAEKEQVQSIWQRVAEDYAPFGVDVTTQDPGFAGINKDSSSDTVYGTRALVTPSDTAQTALCGGGNNCGGVAYINVYGEVGNSHQPAWIFPQDLGPNDTKNVAEAISHEVGHNFGLQHDGRTSPAEGYYRGHAMWAPIMGAGYNRPVTQWSKGEYTSANNTGQDDVARIAAKTPYRTDEAGGTVDSAASGLPTVGYITTATDTDTFSLGPCSGTVTLSATGAAPSPDLDIQLELLDAAGTAVATDNLASAFVNRDTASGLSASISTGVAAGTHYARVDGVGNGTAATGYSDYASIGAYTLSVTGCANLSAPSAPTNLQVTPAADGQSATVTWSPPASDGGSGVTGYALTRTGGTPLDLGVVGTHTWTGLTPGTNYTFTVAAKNAVGPGPQASASASRTTPGAPAITKARSGRPGGKKTAKVSWTAPATIGASALTGYQVLVFKASGGTVFKSFNVAAGRTSYKAKLKRGKYKFAVVALNAVGAGSRSARSKKVTAR